MVRMAYEGERRAVEDLWTACFDDTPEFVAWNFDKNYNFEYTVVAEADNKVVSAMQMNPFSLRIRNQFFLSCGIWGVSTYPRYRRRGFVRKMFDYAVPALFSTGCEISVLAAAVGGMYEKFGYVRVCDINSYKLCDVRYSHADNLDRNLILKLNGIYKKAMSEVEVYAERTYEYWEKTIYVLRSIYDGQILLTKNGYALVYSDGDGYIASEVFGVDTEKKIKKFPVMARVVNVMAVLKKLAPYIKSGTIIKVCDAAVDENNVCVCIDRGEVLRCTSKIEAMNIAEFTEMIFGLVEDKNNIYINFPLEI